MTTEQQEKALVTRENQLSIQELAQSAIDSGWYKDIKTAEQAIMKIVAGKELGLSPLFSLQKLLVVGNTITCMGEVIVYLWQKDGYTWQRILYNKKGEDIELSTTEDKNLYGCGILLWGPAGKLLTKDSKGEAKPCTFDLGRAAIAGLSGKDNWRNYPDRLLFYRAVAFTARDYTPGITGGMPTTEEMQDVELQKASVKQISTGGGVATIEHINIEAPMCPKHNVPFELKKGQGGATWWAHIADEKSASGKAVWCNKSKVDEELAKDAGKTPPAQPQSQPWPSGQAVSEPFNIMDKNDFSQRVKELMNIINWDKNDLLSHVNRHFKIMALSDMVNMKEKDRIQLIKDLNELVDLKNQ